MLFPDGMKGLTRLAPPPWGYYNVGNWNRRRPLQIPATRARLLQLSSASDRRHTRQGCVAGAGETIVKGHADLASAPIVVSGKEESTELLDALRDDAPGAPPLVFARGTRYGHCCEAYSGVRNLLGRRDAISSYDDQQEYYSRVADTFRRLFLPVRAGRLDLARVPKPVREIPESWLPGNLVGMREHYGLVSAASWHMRGVQYPQLPYRLYPERGTYFATPFSSWAGAHFELFQDWLDGGGLHGVDTAMDVGTGIGVLSFMMLEVCERLHVTSIDVNPHALASVKANVAKRGEKRSSECH